MEQNSGQKEILTFIINEEMASFQQRYVIFSANCSKTINMQQMNLDPYFTPYIKINSKYNLNLRAKTIKHLEENKGEDPGLGKEFLQQKHDL